MRDAGRETPPEIPASLIILAAVMALFAPALLQSDGLIYPAHGQFSDLTITHWPAFQYLRDALDQRGAIPMWRTSILGGTPFAADPVTGVWYPPNWLSVVLPLEWFFKLIVVAHLFLGGWAMMCLARSFGVGWVGATASGLAYAIAPRAVGHVGAGHITLVEAWAWMPIVAWTVRRDSTWRGAVASGVALGMCALADLRVAVYAAAIIVLHALAVRDDARPFRERLSRLLTIGVMMALVSTAVWLPALSLAEETTRADMSSGEAGVYSLSAEYLLGTLLAGRGDVERLTYLGLPVLALALVGAGWLWRERRRAAVWLIALAAIGVIGAMGVNTPLYEALFRLPGVSLLRVPGRAWFLVAFAGPLMCGMGVHALMRHVSTQALSRKWKLTSLLVASFAFLFGLGGALIASSSEQPGSERTVFSFVALAVFLPLAIGLVTARLSGRLSPMRFGVGILLLIAIDLAWVGWGQFRVVPVDEVFADGRGAAEYLASVFRESASGGKVYSPSYSLPQHVAQARGLELVDGIDPLQLARTAHFMQTATGVGEWGYSVTLPAFAGLEQDEDIRSWLSDVVPAPTLLGVLGVRYVVAHFPIAHADLVEVARIDGAFVYENLRALPRAWVVSRVDAAQDQREAIDWLLSHDPGREAVVEGGRPLDLDMAPSEAQIFDREPDRVVVSARGPGLLVLSEPYARDWRASIDGVAAQIVPTDGVLRGVYLAEGQHEIEFVFDPVTVKVGVALSGVGIVGWLSGSLFARRRLRA